MNRRDGVYPGSSLRRLGPLAALGCAFFLGGLLGSVLAGLIAGSSGGELESFLTGYLTAAQAGEVSVSLWAMAWEQGRFFLGVCLLGITALGVAGIPALFFLRGFLFSFSVAAFCRLFGPAGLASAFFLFGLPALVWAPVLFLAGCQCLEGSLALLRRVLGEGRGPLPQGCAYWGRLALYALALGVCVVLECMAAPVLLKGAARFVL